MYSYSRFAKHTFIMGILQASGIIQSLVFLPVITKILGAEDYGIWIQLKVTMGLLIPFGFLGLCSALGRFLPGEKNKEKIQEGVSSSLAIITVNSLIIALLLMIFSRPLAALFGFLPVFVRILSFIIIFESLNTVFFTIIQAQREIERYFWFSILNTFGEIGLVVAAIALGYGLYGAIFSLLIIRIIVFLILSGYAIKKIGIKIPDFSLIKDYFRFGIPTMTNAISYWLVASSDRYAIGLFLGAIFVGYYTPAYSIGMLLIVFIISITSILSVVLPKFFDDNNLNEVKNYLSHSLKYFLLIMIPAVFGLSVLSRQLLTILSTKEIADNAYLVTPFIAASMLVYGIACFFNQILVLVKKTKLIAIIWALVGLLNILLNIIFVPIFGIISAAITTFLSYFCAFVLIWYFASRELKFNIDWGFIAKSSLASFLMAALIAWLDPLDLSGVVLSIISGAFIYGAIMLLFKGVGKKEIDFLKTTIHEMAFFNK